MDFWEKQRQKLQQEGKLPTPRREPVIGQNQNSAWWADDSLRGNMVETGPPETQEPQHDFSKANHLRDKSGNCPNCGSGDFMSSTASSAPRCFQCGYIQGREVNDLNVFNVAVTEAPTLKVRQASAAQGVRMGKSLAEINAANAQLERSAQGKAQIDS